MRTSVEEKLTRLTRYLDGMDKAEVHFFEERNPRISEREVCEVTVHSHSHIVRAKAAAPDSFTAVDRVIDKLEHRMVKLKSRLVGRSHSRRNGSVHSPSNLPSADDDTETDEDQSKIV